MTEAAAAATTAPDAGAAAPTTPDLGAATTGSTEGPWYDGMSDELKGYVENKGWKDSSATVESYRNLEKLVGAPEDQILKLPQGDAPPEEWGKVWDKLGRPEEAKGYEFETEAGANEGMVDWAREAFHELGLPKGMGEGLMAKYTEFENAQMTAEEERYTAQTAKEANELKTEWGAAFEQNAGLAKAAAVKLGIDGPTVDKLERVLGFSGVLKLFHNIGSRTGESEFISSGSGTQTGVMTPSAAKARIGALRADSAFVQRYTANETGAIEEMKRLHEWAYPE